MGFGLWENLDPTAPKKMKKRKPPPPPPKAEPIWYNCTVTVSETVNSHELDMLETQDIFTHMQTRLVHWFTFATKSLNLNQMYYFQRRVGGEWFPRHARGPRRALGHV